MVALENGVVAHGGSTVHLFIQLPPRENAVITFTELAHKPSPLKKNHAGEILHTKKPLFLVVYSLSGFLNRFVIDFGIRKIFACGLRNPGNFLLL